MNWQISSLSYNLSSSIINKNHYLLTKSTVEVQSKEKKKSNNNIGIVIQTNSKSHLRNTIGSPQGVHHTKSKKNINYFLHNKSILTHKYQTFESSKIQNHHYSSIQSDQLSTPAPSFKKQPSHKRKTSQIEERNNMNYNKIMQKIDKKQKIIKELKQLKDQKISNKRKYFYQIDKNTIQPSVLKNQLHNQSFTYLKQKIFNKLQITPKINNSKANYKNSQQNLIKPFYYTPKIVKQNSKQNLNSNYKQMSNCTYLDNTINIPHKYSSTNTSYTLNVQSPLSKTFQSNILNKQLNQMRDIKQIISINPTHKSKSGLSIHDFKIGKTLGEGKFGLVYQARHKSTNFLVAIKKIKKSSIKQNYLIDQFLLQIKIQSYCDHQNILKLYGHFDDREYIYLILEYMEEGTLFKCLKVSKIFNQQQASRKIRQVASAIYYLHSNGIAHRDIKPQNIVLTNGVGKLCDFGWATLCNQRRKTYCGTFDYAAPEILQGQYYDLSVDLWCLGVLAYQLLVGKAPFYHISRKQTMKKILNVQTENLSFPAQMSRNAISFIQNLVRKKPQQRMSSSNILKHSFLLQQQ